MAQKLSRIQVQSRLGQRLVPQQYRLEIDSPRQRSIEEEMRADPVEFDKSPMLHIPPSFFAESQVSDQTAQIVDRLSKLELQFRDLLHKQGEEYKVSESGKRPLESSCKSIGDGVSTYFPEGSGREVMDYALTLVDVGEQQTTDMIYETRPENFNDTWNSALPKMLQQSVDSESLAPALDVQEGFRPVLSSTHLEYLTEIAGVSMSDRSKSPHKIEGLPTNPRAILRAVGMASLMPEVPTSGLRKQRKVIKDDLFPPIPALPIIAQNIINQPLHERPFLPPGKGADQSLGGLGGRVEPGQLKSGYSSPSKQLRVSPNKAVDEFTRCFDFRVDNVVRESLEKEFMDKHKKKISDIPQAESPSAISKYVKYSSNSIQSPTIHNKVDSSSLSRGKNKPNLGDHLTKPSRLKPVQNKPFIKPNSSHQQSI